MKSKLEAEGPIFSLSTYGTSCKSCVMPRLLARDFRDWDHAQDGPLDEAIMEHVEQRCGSCQDSVWAQLDGDNHYVISIYQRE